MPPGITAHRAGVRLRRMLSAYRVKPASLRYEHSPNARTSAVLSLNLAQCHTGALREIKLTSLKPRRNVPLAPFAGCPALAAWQTRTAVNARVTSRFPSAHLPLLTVIARCTNVVTFGLALRFASGMLADYRVPSARGFCCASPSGCRTASATWIPPCRQRRYPGP